MQVLNLYTRTSNRQTSNLDEGPRKYHKIDQQPDDENLPAISLTHGEYASHPTSTRRKWIPRISFFRPSLKKTIALGLATAVIVLILNTALLIWSLSSFQANKGIITLYEGSCTQTNTIKKWSAVAINVLATLLLGASNNCAQFLSSPTRAEVDLAHARGSWLHIGVPNIRNLRHISRTRCFLWVCLLLSSAPLHLLWNSVVFSTRSATDYIAVLVTPDFLNGGYCNETIVEAYANANLAPYLSDTIEFDTAINPVTRLQSNIPNLTTLNNADCIRAYGTQIWETEWRNVLVVTNASFHQNVLNIYWHAAGDEWDSNWICTGKDESLRGSSNQSETAEHICNTNALIQNAQTWKLPDIFDFSYIEVEPTTEESYYDTGTITFVGQTASTPAQIDYCLAEPFPPNCTVELSLVLLGVVILCNMVKVVCLTKALLLGNWGPLTTIGDALSSFLRTPDSNTVNMGPLTCRSVYNNLPLLLSRRAVNPPQPWYPRRSFWYASASKSRWIVSTVLFAVVIITALSLLATAQSNGLTASLWKGGIGFEDESQIIDAGFGLLAEVSIANSFQIAISCLYVFYNTLITCMLMSQETMSFCIRPRIVRMKILNIERKTGGPQPLRTTFPLEGQKAAYFLNIPTPYAIFLMTGFGILHYLVSQSIFLVQIKVYDINGTEDYARTVSACGYSAEGILISLVVGVVLAAPLYLLGFLHYPAGMPMIGSCSIAISAACHPSSEERKDVAHRPVAYGVITEGSAKGRAGFSTLPVDDLQAGAMYSTAPLQATLQGSSTEPTPRQSWDHDTHDSAAVLLDPPTSTISLTLLPLQPALIHKSAVSGMHYEILPSDENHQNESYFNSSHIN